ncbi:ribosomal maturation YjgA family protein [Bacteroides sp.]
MKKRLFYLFCFIVILAVEVFIGMYVRDAFVRPYLGDALVVVLIYCFVRIFIPRGIRWLPVYVFAFACFIEVMQYFRLVDVLGLTNRVARIVLGATFDLKDILSYAAGCLFILIAERGLKRSE